MRLPFLYLTIPFVLLMCCAKQTVNYQDVTIIYLVRHAEKDLSDVNERDPSLTLEGKKRAERLAFFFKDIDLDAVYSTDYIRTRDTGKEIAGLKDLPLSIYDPKSINTDDFIGKTVLIVGHSNSTPKLVNRLLKKDYYPPINEVEYTNLYQVILSEQDTIHQLFHLY